MRSPVSASAGRVPRHLPPAVRMQGWTLGGIVAGTSKPVNLKVIIHKPLTCPTSTSYANINCLAWLDTLSTTHLQLHRIAL